MIVADSVRTSDVGIPLDLAISPDGTPVVCWTEGTIGEYRIFVAEPRIEGWTRTVIGTASHEAQPRMLFDSTGRLIIAWGGDYAIAGGGYVVRQQGATAWPAAKPIHSRCEGDIALSLVDGTVRIAFIRAVAKWDLRKFVGNIVHDPPRQDYFKLAVAHFTGDQWEEDRILERDNLLDCSDPALANEHLVYARESLAGRSARMYVDVCGRDPPASIGPRLQEYTHSFDVAAVDGHPLVVLEGGLGSCIVVERERNGWSAPVALPLGNYCIRASGDGPRVHAVAVTRESFEIRYSSRVDGIWSTPTQIASGQSCAMRALRGKPLVCWVEGWELKHPERARKIYLMRAR